MSKERWILHADMDAFYASVEQRDDPRLRGKPVIIGANSERGVVSAASYEARKFGVRSAMPGFQARQKCPDGIFLPGDMKKYAKVSKQVHAIFREFTNQIEPLALDEAFLDISGSIGLFGPPAEIGRRIKERVKQELDLAVSVGIAPNKLVAKIACSRGKPDGLLLVRQDEIRKLMDPLPVRALWGIGPKAETRLRRARVTTISQLAECPLSVLRRALGDHAAEIQRRARGIDERPVESERSAKSIGEEATFSDNVSDEQRISAAITSHAETVASRARRAGLVGKTVTLKVKLARRKTWGDRVVANHELFPVLNRQARLPTPGADGTAIRSLALELWKKLALTEPIRLLGVTLSDLSTENTPRQMGLFDLKASPSALGDPTSDSPRPRATRAEALGKALDAISERFGEGAIGRAAGSVEKITAGDRLKVGALDDVSDESDAELDDD